MYFLLFPGLSAAVAVLLVLLLARSRKRSGLRGPTSSSWLLGNEMELRTHPEAGGIEGEWTKQYGNVMSFRGCFGAEHILVADPKALQYIFHTSGYRFPKTGDGNHSFDVLLGQGLETVGGETHRRQRAILTPAFSTPQLKSYLPIFHSEADKLCELMKAEIGDSGSKVLNVADWTKRFALDLLGISTFRYDFHALDGKETELTKKLNNVFGVATAHPEPASVLYMALWRIFPSWLLAPLAFAMCTFTPFGHLKTFRNTSVQISRGIQKGVLEDKDHINDKDIVGILASSTLTSDKAKRMSEYEMNSQMASFMFAGQDTISLAMSFLFYELARAPKDQDRLRAEITALLAKKEGKPLTITDYESLTFLNACLKESLRLNPVATLLSREPLQDDALPLSEPVTLVNGDTVTQVPIKKGQTVFCSISAYNRLKSVWGEDADEWNPERFLKARHDVEQTKLGVFGNTLTFSGGNRSCIAWRFALIELYVLTVKIFQSFELEAVASLRKVPAGVMMFPVVVGKESEGAQIPLKAKIIE